MWFSVYNIVIDTLLWQHCFHGYTGLYPNMSSKNCSVISNKLLPKQLLSNACRAVARTLIGGGGCIFIYSGSARLASFEINFISKETSRAEPEYMNTPPPPPN